MGRPVFYGPTVGAVLKKKDDEWLVSLSASGVNWKDWVPIEKLTLDGTIRQASTRNEVFEKEDAGCEGGACKI